MWHPDCEAILNSDRPEFRLPHAYPELVAKHALSAERAGPWPTLDALPTGDRHSYGESDTYADPMEAELHGDLGAEIACFTRFDPYEKSRYRAKDGASSEGPPARRWVFVAQVDRKSALRAYLFSLAYLAALFAAMVLDTQI